MVLGLGTYGAGSILLSLENDGLSCGTAPSHWTLVTEKNPNYPSLLVCPNITATVHIEYDPDALPPKPSEDWTCFVCIGDTHAHKFDVPNADVLLHSGDLTHPGK